MDENEFEKNIKKELRSQMTQVGYEVFVEDCIIKICSDKTVVISSEFSFTNAVLNEKFGEFIKEYAKSILGVDEIKLVFKTFEDDVMDQGLPLSSKYFDTVLHNALEYIKEEYKYTSVDPFVFDLFFKDIGIYNIEKNEEELTTVYLDLPHKIIAEILQECFKDELTEGFSQAMNEDVFVRYTVDGDDYTRDNDFIDGMK